ncbi:lysylphosphatidylglycerol synthase transmembrane domain-containing protein [Aquimarina sp. 2201CG14-23]|uniref:lysylphosphatidylglycerol synthase transmembrane domain-containing protein n=1 Tax=Aquimarina mycalae TaxID=3040073 RepID=UPI002477D88A|nr:lysylphosphatidylglycerol synthase transmembrane domain-containing protein [Aquimarina sp. 2201CG14-23]MDH7446134.1 lysylphosphatidylglycerol synthase transmembrane domain-containing protein [Aquimarina sp. 2201CG14-23]
MNPKLIKFLKIVLPLLLGVFLIWYFLSSATPEYRTSLLKNIKNADPFWVFISLTLGIISHLSRAYRWKFLLNPLGYSPKLYNSFMTVMAGYLANLGIPRSGEVLRGFSLSTYEKIPFEKAFGTIVSERIIDLIMLIIVTSMAGILQTEYLLNFLEEKNINPVFTLGIILILIIIGLLGLRILKKSSNTFIVKIRDFGMGLLDGMKSIFTMKQKWAFLFHTVLIWFLYVLMFYVIKFAIPNLGDASIGVILVAFVVGSFSMSTTNGGIGILPFPIVVGAVFVFFGFEKSDGEAFGWILWGSQTAINIVIGALSFLFLPILNREKTT